MAKRLTVWFDKEADFLEFSFGPKKKGFFREVKEDIFQRVDTGGSVIGFAIFNFAKRERKEQKIALPVDIILKALKRKVHG